MTEIFLLDMPKVNVEVLERYPESFCGIFKICNTTLHNDRLLLSNCAIYAIKLLCILSTRQ